MKLPQKGTIHDAAHLVSAMRQALATGAALSLDGSGVEHIDTCVLQLLCAAQRTAPGTRLDHPSHALLEAIHRTGLGKAMLNPAQETA